jgi:hypothetical protein
MLSVLSAATAQVKFATKFFKVTEATVQSWSPGASRNTGKTEGGFVYQVKATVTKASQLQFDSLVVDGNMLAIEVVKGTQRNYKGPFSKGDQLTILARTENGASIKKASTKLLEAMAQKKGSGFISYRVKGKPYLYSISKFTEVSGQTKNQ